MSRPVLRKLVYPAAERNKEPILNELKKYIISAANLKLLEISSGSGQHIGYVAPHFPNITFQPSEYDLSTFNSISAYAEDCPTKNICQPVQIDIRESYTKWNYDPERPEPYFDCKRHIPFSELNNRIDYMLNVNMIHISSFDCTVGLFRNAGALLKKNGLLFTYGPYAENGILTPQSNINFDLGLKRMNPEYGVRDLLVLKEVALSNNIRCNNYVNMPANNKLVIWEKVTQTC